MPDKLLRELKQAFINKSHDKPVEDRFKNLKSYETYLESLNLGEGKKSAIRAYETLME